MTDWAEGEKAQSLFDDVLCPWGAGDLSDRDALLALAAALREARGEWISVEDRLPGECEYSKKHGGRTWRFSSEVNVLIDGEPHVATFWTNGEGCHYWEFEPPSGAEDSSGEKLPAVTYSLPFGLVTHWRPLPSPREVAP